MAEIFEDGETKEAVREKLNGNAEEINGMGKMYAAFITQSGAVAPSYQVNLNTTGRTWTSSRTGAGDFRLLSDIAFDVSKIEIIIGNQQQGMQYTYYAQSTTKLVIRTHDGTSFVDDAIDSTTIKITIYS